MFDPDRMSLDSARRLLEFAESPVVHWDAGDLPEVLATFLALPAIDALEADPELASVALPRQILSEMRRPLGELMRDPDLSEATLVHIKQCMRLAVERDDPGVTREIAMLVYYTGMALLLERTGDPQTRLRPDQLRRGFRWMAELTWAPSWMTELGRSCLNGLDSGDWSR